MATVQIVIERKLLQTADQAARKTKRNRSALVRDALREHLKRIEIRAQEERDRAGYLKHPQDLHEVELWERQAAWPAE